MSGSLNVHAEEYNLSTEFSQLTSIFSSLFDLNLHLEKVGLPRVREDFPIPKIIAVGSEAAGKCTLLNRLFGFSVFPEAYGRKPFVIIEVELRHKEVVEPATMSVYRVDLRHWHAHGTLQSEQLLTLDAQGKALVEETMKRCTWCSYSSDMHKIVITVSGPNIPNLTVVNLPAVARDDDSQSAESKMRVLADLLRIDLGLFHRLVPDETQSNMRRLLRMLHETGHRHGLFITSLPSSTPSVGLDLSTDKTKLSDMPELIEMLHKAEIGLLKMGLSGKDYLRKRCLETVENLADYDFVLEQPVELIECLLQKKLIERYIRSNSEAVFLFVHESVMGINTNSCWEYIDFDRVADRTVGVLTKVDQFVDLFDTARLHHLRQYMTARVVEECDEESLYDVGATDIPLPGFFAVMSRPVDVSSDKTVRETLEELDTQEQAFFAAQAMAPPHSYRVGIPCLRTELVRRCEQRLSGWGAQVLHGLRELEASVSQLGGDEIGCPPECHIDYDGEMEARAVSDQVADAAGMAIAEKRRDVRELMAAIAVCVQRLEDLQNDPTFLLK